MPDLQDDHKILETSSRPDCGTTTTSTLLDLAPELILRVASLLEIRDLLAFRRSHKLLYGISQDKLLWRRILRNLQLPLSRILRSGSLDDLPYTELEKAVQHSYTAENQWLKRREAGLTLPRMNDHTIPIYLLDFLDDRWIISIPARGLPAIWDTRENPPKLCKLHESASQFFQAGTIDVEAAVDPRQGDVVIWLRKDPLEKLAPQILRIHLADQNTDSLQLTAYQTIEDLDPGVIALEPSRNLVIAEAPDVYMQLGDWIHGRTVQINAPAPSTDYRFGSILSVRLVGDYIVSFRNKCIELVFIPPFPGARSYAYETDPPFYRFHLHYPNTSFTDGSLSEPQPNPESPEDSLIVYVLAPQRVGCFYFRVTVYNPRYIPFGPRARMDVDLLGVYELKHRGSTGACLVPAVWLGTQGKRGLWIERPLSLRAHMRFIVAASFEQSGQGAVAIQSGENLQELSKTVPRIETTGDALVVDFLTVDDDISWCAFSEATGRIVLMTLDERIVLL